MQSKKQTSNKKKGILVIYGHFWGVYQPIQIYCSLFWPIPSYSSSFQPNSAYQGQIQPISVYSSLFQPILAYNSLYHLCHLYHLYDQSPPQKRADNLEIFQGYRNIRSVPSVASDQLTVQPINQQTTTQIQILLKNFNQRLFQVLQVNLNFGF